MPQLTYDDLLWLAQSAGFGATSSTAAAIGMAESRGVTDAVGDLDKGGSYGLWQIHIPSHPEWKGHETDLFDPATNAQAAYATYVAAGKSFTPWSVYKSGAYKQFLPKSAQRSGFGKAAFATFMVGLLVSVFATKGKRER